MSASKSTKTPAPPEKTMVVAPPAPRTAAQDAWRQEQQLRQREVQEEQIRQHTLRQQALETARQQQLCAARPSPPSFAVTYLPPPMPQPLSMPMQQPLLMPMQQSLPMPMPPPQRDLAALDRASHQLDLLRAKIQEEQAILLKNYGPSHAGPQAPCSTPDVQRYISERLGALAADLSAMLGESISGTIIELRVQRRERLQTGKVTFDEHSTQVRTSSASSSIVAPKNTPLKRARDA
jgi:hypothetical protein